MQGEGKQTALDECTFVKIAKLGEIFIVAAVFRNMNYHMIPTCQVHSY